MNYIRPSAVQDLREILHVARGRAGQICISSAQISQLNTMHRQILIARSLIHLIASCVAITILFAQAGNTTQTYPLVHRVKL